jgi:hypothetical protein
MQKKLWACLVPHLGQKILSFGPPFCRMELNTIQKFWHSELWPQEPKRAASCMENFGILDGPKHTHENFGILHFIIPKYLVFLYFAFHGELNAPYISLHFSVSELEH